MNNCRGPTMQSLRLGRTEDGAGIYRCFACGKEGAWSDGWCYWGNVECKKCGGAHVNWIACSEACSLQLASSEQAFAEHEARTTEHETTHET